MKGNRNQTWRFLGIFFATIAVYYLLTLSPWVDANVIYPVLKLCARETSALLNFIGDKTSVDGVVVRGADYSVGVRRGCDPLEPIVLFTAGVLAFPARWKQKGIGLALGASLLFVMNLVRIGSLYLLGAAKSPLFTGFHLWWWPAFFIVGSLALWILWLLWIQQSAVTANQSALSRA